MSKIWIAVLAGAGGIFVGIQLSKAYAKSEIKDTSHDLLNLIGLGGGRVQGVVDQVVLPLIVN